jgi:hypothetical protein
LVVQNLSELNVALKKIEEEFILVSRKPPTDDITHKEPFVFQFDDLRLYLKRKVPNYMPPADMDNMVFELQVKTFLQHAWALSTHDLIYKTDQINWARQRVAYQIKAMLEQAEIAISGVDCLTALPELNKENQNTKELNAILRFLSANFSVEQLPADLLRLSQSIQGLMANFRLPIDKLQGFLDKESLAGRGTSTMNLSPYSIILESIKHQDQDRFKKAFKKDARLKPAYVFIPKEINIEGINLEDKSKIIRS